MASRGSITLYHIGLHGHGRINIHYSITSILIRAFQLPITSRIMLTYITYLAQTIYLYNNPPPPDHTQTEIQFYLTISGDDFDVCTEYVQIKNESLYDRDPKSVNDLSKRPLGFMSVVIPFETNNADARNPCFTLSLDDSAKQTVQVLVSKQPLPHDFSCKTLLSRNYGNH